MRFILRLKHWQLFLWTIGIPILSNIFGVTGPGREGPIDILIGTVTVLGVFGWIWAIANELYKKLPDRENFKIWIFRLLFFSALIILVWVFWTVEISPTKTDNEFPIAFFSIPVYLGLMIYVVLFAARTLKSLELGRQATFADYSADAFLIWMVPIGIWIIQPRLNKLTEE